MNEQRSFERRFADRMEAERGSTQLPDAFYDDFRLQARDARQRPRWLALIKEPPMRISSSLAVGSPMARVVAITIATLLLALLAVGAGIAGTRLLAADDAIVVAQDGSGTVTTITEAVAMAEDGDTVLVRPGTYVEAVIIEEDISLIGDGPRAEIIIEAPEDGPTARAGDLSNPRPEAAYALLLQDVDATVSGLTFRGEPSRVHASGGSPMLKGLALEDVGRGVGDRDGGEMYGGVIVSGGSRATIRDSIFEGGNGVRAYDDSEPLVSGNELRAGAVIFGQIGDGSVIRGNEITGGAIGMSGATTALIEGNVISDAPFGIWIDSHDSDEEIGPTIRENSISGGGTGIEVTGGGAPTIEGNTLTTNRVGIFLSQAGAAALVGNDLADNAIGIGIHGSAAQVEGNTVRGGTTGVSVSGEATAALAGNTIEGAANRGLFIGRGASPTLTENRACDNGTNLVIDEGADPMMQDNDICPDPPAPAEG